MPRTTPKSTTIAADLPFEQAKKELETIVRKLEEGQLPLAEALALFERGQALATRCGALLAEAELKVKQLVPQGDGYELQEFEGAEE
jgi:exodeoxyribonuclease VII small subunit